MTSAEERFTDLFGRTHQPLLAYALRRCAEPADAADVVAETMLVAWRRLDQIPGEGQERAWLFGVARKVLANQRRGRLRQHALADRLRQELAVTDSAPVLAPVPVGLASALASLSENDRELLLLLAWDGLGHDETAIALGISPGALRVRLHRARRRLSEALGSPAPHPTPLELRTEG